MDDILFRHTAIATPNDKAEAFLLRVNATECGQSLINEAKEFDQLLKDALHVDVPDDLRNKILLKQSFLIKREKKINHRWHIAVAASIAFIIGLNLSMLGNLYSSPSDIGSIALQHIQHASFFTDKVNEKASLQSVNVKLARYGGVASEGLGEVLFVNYCAFEGTSALHLILKGEKGRVNVFVVPEDAGFKEIAEFSNQHLKGISERLGKTNVVIVGERGESLNKMKEKLATNIQWEI